MLRKLLKHEFRATARIMVPVYLVLLVTALGANFSTRGILETPYAVLNILGSLLVMAFVVAIMAVCVVSFLLMIQRFYKNLLRDEGYLMLTLPASIHQQVWSKLIVSSVWFIITGVVVMLSFVMMALDVSFLEGMVQVLQQLFQDITAYYAINGTVFLLELPAVLRGPGHWPQLLQPQVGLVRGVLFHFAVCLPAGGKPAAALPEYVLDQLSAGQPGFPGVRDDGHSHRHGHSHRCLRGIFRRVLCNYHILLEKTPQLGVN